MLNLNDTRLLNASSRFHSDGRPKSMDTENLLAWRRSAQPSVSSNFIKLKRALWILAGQALGSRSDRGPDIMSEMTEFPIRDATEPCPKALDKAA